MFSLDHHQLQLCTEYNTAANNYDCGYNGMERLSKLFNRRVKKDGDASHKCTTNKNSDANDLTAYSCRIVPFISGKAFEWMKKNPTALPLDRFGNYF